MSKYRYYYHTLKLYLIKWVPYVLWKIRQIIVLNNFFYGIMFGYYSCWLFFYDSVNILLSVVKWSLTNIFDWFSYIVIFHMISIISKLIYIMSLVIRSSLLLIPECVIYYFDASFDIVDIWYTKSSIIGCLFENLKLCATHIIMYIRHLNPIIVTLRRSKCIQSIMLTMVHTVC